ncbi:MAG TPA: undecaprenyl-diphosphatase UppP [Syntrophothermus lipocalidus]|nr:undecaprenyl-diphosphatase UppP [Syntrophothermus lipocalidus]
MNYLDAVILGIVQGLTEFLPVSSSGHLVIFQKLLGFQQPGVTFEVMLHLGTLVAVIAAFWSDVWGIIKKPMSRIVYLIILGTIPAGLIGVFLKPLFEQAFESLTVVGVGLIITGFLLVLGEKLGTRAWWGKEVEQTSVGDALFIGLLQGLAITPGISRSGSTISAGLLRGLDREFAARFSFLLSIPAILGAGILEGKDILDSGIAGHSLAPYIVGTVTAAVSSYIAIRIVMGLVKRGRLSLFSYYCWTVGILILAFFRG